MQPPALRDASLLEVVPGILYVLPHFILDTESCGGQCLPRFLDVETELRTVIEVFCIAELSQPAFALDQSHHLLSLHENHPN